MLLKNRKESEINHGKKICSNAESVWGWATDAGKLRADRRAGILFKLGELHKANVVLEIGCGTGEFTKRLLGMDVNKLVVVDISLDLIKKARVKTAEFSSRVKFVVADVEKLPFKDNVVQAVVGISVLHHLDFCVAMKEISRILKPGGKMVFTEPNMLNPQIFFLKHLPVINRFFGWTDGESAFVRWDVAKKLSSFKFGSILVSTFDFLHPQVPKAMIKPISLLGAFFEKTPVLKEIAGSLIIFAENKKN